MCCGPSSSSSQTSSKIKRRNVSPLISTPYEKTTEGPAPVMYTAEKYEDLKKAREGANRRWAPIYT
ncbi:hypothetical protein NW752_011156 [Fusarium irregulare]|uniref:Uncharacterized protein n=1 Tax=Fusarium irregulare TaxID=2494466 RepID=A0A9W8PE56_9HYPO|nr:hypothetical protein NW766_012185 [Fusarium irregulare]KAJ4005826.1 hypothetical protein NW752_011156 [Fusarium irregulare]